MHTTVASVHTASPSAAVGAVGAVGAVEWSVGQIVEVRLDALWTSPPDPEDAASLLEDLLAAATVPLVATLRPRRQGGGFEGSEEVRIGLLEAAARAGFAWIDVENDLLAIAPLLHHLSKATRKIVLSNHLTHVPDRDVGGRHLTAMQDLGGRLHKLAFPWQDLASTLRALELVRLHAGRGGRPAVTPVGAGADVRALLAVVGNHATFGAAAPAVAAPGQPALEEVRATWRGWGIQEAELATVRDWYGVLGDPVAHSLSPRIHNAALREAGLLARAGALQVPDAPGMLHLAIATAPRTGLAGASVMAPHKQALVRVAEPDGVAAAVGAANCLWFEDGFPRCSNTDAAAFLRLLRGSRSVRVLGAGGSARAACWAAQRLGLDLEVSARDASAADALAKDFGGTPLAWDRRHTDPEMVVQCTPADVWAGPAPPRAIELVYAEHTRLVAVTPPERLVTGTDFLVEQAVDAFRIWTGQPPAAASMRTTLGL